jgi:Leucine-rich repeat (LRR) protein
MTSLTTLELYGTQITDAGLEHLKDLTSLTMLHLNDTQICVFTDAASERDDQAETPRPLRHPDHG